GRTTDDAAVHAGSAGPAAPPGVAVNVEDLPFLGGELEVIHLAGLGDDAVKSAGCDAGSSRCSRVVGAGLDGIGQIDDAELEAGRADAVGSLAVAPPVRLVDGRQCFHRRLDGD